MLLDYHGKGEWFVKVFISWSGDYSKEIAKVLKHWIKSVIQSVTPFVSSEDIPKGSRWSVDLSKELQDTHFGILCVTKDNFEKPWLLFEAGALSKTLDKSYVVPLLFDLEPSDLSDSPLMQFQVASFSKDEIRKLVGAINAASGNKLDVSDLDKAFEVWYPHLVEGLNNIADNAPEKDDDSDVDVSEKSSQILEEILVLSRESQKLLRNSESRAQDESVQIAEKLDFIRKQGEINRKYPRRYDKFSHVMIEDLLAFGNKLGANFGITLALSFFREDYPWIYDSGRSLLETLKFSESHERKHEEIRVFRDLLEYTEWHCLKSDSETVMKRGARRDMVFREISMRLMQLIEEAFHSNEVT